MSVTPHTLRAMSKSSIQPRLGDDEWHNWAYQASPLFRWAGGKRRFILGNSDKFPDFNGTYHEPFAGSLAVFFWLASKSEYPFKARLSDVNLRLIRVYQEVRNQPNDVWEELENLISGYKRSTDPGSYYYRVREDFNLSAPRGDAARFMFLMATGFNGVYRTNSKGQFNVPHGSSDKSPRFPGENEIQVASVVLSHADLRACSWETSLSATSAGDFVFLDPPYLGTGNQDSRIYETERAFTFRDHERLANELVNLKNRSVDFMLTNSASKELLELYKDLGLSVEIVSSRRSINSKTDDRGEEAELIVTPGTGQQDRHTHEDDFDLRMRMLKARKEKQ